ncbi:hypothetical protein HK100_012836 [Physocladia obscura]|uniref:Uncharacterized protein n=1 Tax=Physocladia obscura TaxID=109957 RepID=A0AAD5SZ84_9FUNG|nr:hypothetical protein HK100_012836 [Physocladia obscura]
MTTKNDPIIKKYSTKQPEIPVNPALLLNHQIDHAIKLNHLESVMFSLLCGNETFPDFSHNIVINAPDLWLKHHLRMLEFPENTIQYELDELARHLGYSRSKKEFPSTCEWNSDVILSLTLHHKNDEFIGQKLSLVLFKISKTAANPTLFSKNHYTTVQDIKVFVKLSGWTHLHNMLVFIGVQ